MYDDLVKRLRVTCGSCKLWDGYKCCLKGECSAQTRLQAADAIEFLQTYKVAFENIISMGGWWLVGQDKNLYCMDVPINWPPKGTKTIKLLPLPEPPKEET